MNILSNRKLYYVHLDFWENGKIVYPGVKKKIENQIKVFKQFGLNVHEIQIQTKSISKIVKRLPGVSGFYNWEDVIKEIRDPDVIYLRHVYLDAGYINFIRTIKNKYKNVIILLELPTYPYDGERFSATGVRKIIDYPIVVKDHYYRSKLCKYVDRIVTYTEDDEIFSIPTIKIQNGIDVASIPVAVPRKMGGVRLIAVASLQPYHGYERIVNGLYDYYLKSPDTVVEFEIVGDGVTKTELKMITEQYGLERYVSFVGTKTGSELESIYNNADIAIGSFGLYKRGTSYSSALKTREYIAHGLPMISGCTEDVFRKHPSEFYLEFPNDNTPVNIEKIVRFYDATYGIYGGSQIRLMIRDYAENNIDIKTTFSPVIKYLHAGMN